MPSEPMTKTRLARFGSFRAGVFVWRSRASGLFGPRALGALGLAACDRPYRAGARAADGRPPGQSPGAVIRLRMQRSELAVRGQPRYPDVRFVDRCHCCCFLTWGSAGWIGLVDSEVRRRHYQAFRKEVAEPRTDFVANAVKIWLTSLTSLSSLNAEGEVVVDC